jgi:predicted transcriptional regulator
MNESTPIDVSKDMDARARRVVLHAVEALGGAAAMVHHGEQAILPALVESAYVLVLRDEAHRDVAEIADFLGISPGAVESVLAAPTEKLLARLRYGEDPSAEFAPHTAPEWSGEPTETRLEPQFLAGALAKFAYDIVRREDGRPSEAAH